MRTVKEFLEDLAVKNIAWFIGVVSAASVLVATVGYHERSLTKIETAMADQHDKIDHIQESVVKLERLNDVMNEDMKDVKQELKEIKNIVLKPITTKDLPYGMASNTIKNIDFLEPDLELIAAAEKEMKFSNKVSNKTSNN